MEFARTELAQAKCSNCNRYIVIPIPYSEPHENNCHSCRRKHRLTRQALQTQIKKVKKALSRKRPCQYSSYGCRKRAGLLELVGHEEKCPLRSENSQPAMAAGETNERVQVKSALASKFDISLHDASVIKFFCIRRRQIYFLVINGTSVPGKLMIYVISTTPYTRKKELYTLKLSANGGSCTYYNLVQPAITVKQQQRFPSIVDVSEVREKLNMGGDNMVQLDLDTSPCVTRDRYHD